MAANRKIASWQGRQIWVIGASAGIGLHLAQQLMGLGARLAVSARQADLLATHFPGNSVHRLPLDVAQDGAVAAGLSTLASQGFVPDMVIWVAGIYQPTPADQLDMAAVRKTIDINLTAAIAGLAAVVPSWLAALAKNPKPVHQPRWVWFSSVAGYRGLPQALAYCSSKAGLNAAAETAYMDLKPHGIEVSVVCPGFVETRLTAQNQFKMPALISAEEAARETIAGLARGEFEVHYPKRFTRFMKFLSLLPSWLYLPIAGRAQPGRKGS